MIQAERARRAAEKSHGSAAEAARSSLASFIRQGWHVLEPGTPLVWNWHLDIICDALERQIRGEQEFRKLVICIPPGMMKSLTVSVFGPAWEWLIYPERRKLNLSNDDRLSARDARRMRELITSDWYLGLVDQLERDRGGTPWRLSKDQNEKVNFENTRRGSRLCRSMGAAITGTRADDICIDDPIDAKAVINGSVDQVRDRMQEAANVIDQVLPSRVNDLAGARWTLIMQRLHEEDPAGRAINEGGWHVISLQMEYDPEWKHNHPGDPRKEAGELMFPAKFPRAEVDILKKKLGIHWWAQYQQDPRPGDGGPLKRWYWRFWYPAEMADPPAPVRVKKPDGTMVECLQKPLPEKLGTHRQSWDMSFKDLKTSAYVVGQVWAELAADSFMLDQVRDKMSFVAAVAAVRMLSARWPHALEKLIEDKANGTAIINMLSSEIAGMIAVQPEGGKEARANASAPACEAGNAYLPHPALHAWVAEFIDECESFPAGAYADQVDAATQYLIRRYLAKGIGFMFAGQG